MSNTQSEESVHVTGEERLHPALRKLGRACIALARWQREQQRAGTEAPASPPQSNQPDASHAARANAERQEASNADA